MANWHLVMAYDDRATDVLSAQGYPHPKARPGNRLPTAVEIEEAVRSFGLVRDAALLVDGIGIAESFRVRGDLVLELRFLRKLCERSGQLWVYPDCGSPAIVVDVTTDADRIAAIWLESLATDNSWCIFHERAYRE